MEKELFGAIRDNYNHASENLWYWHRRQNSFVKLLTFIWVAPASIIMQIIGFIFSLGVLLDKISVWLQSKRNYIVDAVDDSSSDLRYYKSSYFLTPIKVVLLSPVALLLGIIPKWSTTLVTAIHPDFDISTGVEHGYFTTLGKTYLNLTKELFKNIGRHGNLFVLPALIISVILAPVLVLISIIFFALILLDIVGWVVGLIRKFVVSSSAAMARTSGNNFGSVISMPIIMTLFVPIYIVLLLIPKIATYDEA